MPDDIRPRVRRLFSLGIRRRDVVDAQMEEELRFHVEARIERLIATGMSADGARAEAVRRLAGEREPDDARRRLLQSAERKERTMAWQERSSEFVQDMRYAIRGLMNRPGFAAVSILTLAIGIGANTAIFGAVNALLLRPLPFPEPERLMEVSLSHSGTGGPDVTNAPAAELAPWSWPKFVLFRDAQRSFSDVALWSDGQVTLTDGDAERVYGEDVSEAYLKTLGVRPVVGRDFPAGEDAHPGAARLVVISYALWLRRFNADPSIIGRALSIGGAPHEVIGVLPPAFRGLSGRADVLTPITARAADALSEPWSLEFSQIGRLRPAATAERAASEAAVLGQRVYEATPMKDRVGGGSRGAWGASARPLDATRVAPTIRRSLLILFGAVGFVLLIACVNLANLLLGRAAARRKEIAIRIAVGAGRGRLLRLLLTESIVLALLGGVASLGVAWAGTRALSAVNPQSTLQAQQLGGLGVVSFASIRLDTPALLFTFGVALVVGVLFGLLPALSATRVPLQEQLKDGNARTVGAQLRSRVVTSRRVLVVTEIAMALVLLVGAGLMIRSLQNRLQVDPGFDGSHVLTLRLSIPAGQTPHDSLPGFYDQLLERLQAIPGVQRAAMADCPPLNGGCNGTVITFPDRPAAAKGAEPSIGVHVVTPGWFGTMRVPLKRGRLLTAADRIGTPKSIVISEAAARKYWPNEDPIGQRAGIWQGGFQDGATVVGIVGDVRFSTLDSLPVPDTYMSYGQSPRSYMMIFLRTAMDPEAVIGSARQAITELSPTYPPFDVRTMTARVAAASAQARLSAMLFALFGGVALSLAVVGIYGVMSFAVAQRTREIGIRMALGADRRSVLRLVLGEGIGLAVIGAGVGLVAALALSRVLYSLLYEVRPTDPVTYATIAAILGGAALLASWIPARRASRVNPTEALRGA
jgi:predicted permease